MMGLRQRQAANRGILKAGLDADALWQFPAWELLCFWPAQAAERKQPTWSERFLLAGGVLVQGRMVALKTDMVWRRLGSKELFKDGTGTPYPPYARRSGMDWMEVGRAECAQLGLIQIEPCKLPDDYVLKDAFWGRVAVGEVNNACAELLDAAARFRDKGTPASLSERLYDLKNRKPVD